MQEKRSGKHAQSEKYAQNKKYAQSEKYVQGGKYAQERRVRRRSMKIGEVIRRNRKEKQMTQEELAGLLGVTASAVNKWENGSSYPDISLLAPIARTFAITTDELLSYKGELTRQEIVRIVRELSDIMMERGYDELLAEAARRLQEYPNCDSLALNVLLLLDSGRQMLTVAQPQAHERYIRQIRNRLLKSDDRYVTQAAAENGFYDCMNRQAYEEAQQMLAYMPKDAGNYRQMRALLYRRQGDCESAYRIYEEAVLEGYQKISAAFTGLFLLAQEDGDEKEKELILKKQEGLAALFEMGRYQEIYLQYDDVLARGDKEETLSFLRELAESATHLHDFRNSPLYAHIRIGEDAARSAGFMIKQMFERSKELDFVRDEPEFCHLVKIVEEMCETQA